jgi:preprotein translocase SecE subunit
MNREETLKKWVYLGLLGASALIWFLSGELIEYGIYSFNLQRKMRNIFLYGQLTAVGLGIISFLILTNIAKVFSYTQEVVGETDKVSWSSKKEVVATTIVVIIGVIIFGIILGVFDHTLALTMGWILGK